MLKLLGKVVSYTLLLGVISVPTIILGFDIYQKKNTLYLDSSNSVEFNYVVDNRSTYYAVSEIERLEKQKEGKEDKTIYLYIDSPGGEVTSGLKFAEYLKTKKNVVCVIKFAASMAFSIAQQGCNTRVITENAIMMQHRMTISGSGTTDEWKEYLKGAESLEERLNREDAKRIGVSYEKFKELVKNDYWLFGSKEILAANVADKAMTIYIDANISDEFLEKIKSRILANKHIKDLLESRK